LVRLDPRAPAAHATLGSAFAQAGRWAKAVACFRAGLAVAPDDADLPLPTSRLALASSGELPDAVVEFRRADLHVCCARRSSRPTATSPKCCASWVADSKTADHFYDEAERLKLQASRPR